MSELHEYNPKTPPKTPCCYNCKHLDGEDKEKQLAINKFKCTLLNEYKYKYSRCNEHKERVEGTVIKGEQIIILNPKGGVK